MASAGKAISWPVKQRTTTLHCHLFQFCGHSWTTATCADIDTDTHTSTHTYTVSNTIITCALIPHVSFLVVETEKTQSNQSNNSCKCVCPHMHLCLLNHTWFGTRDVCENDQWPISFVLIRNPLLQVQLYFTVYHFLTIFRVIVLFNFLPNNGHGHILLPPPVLFFRVSLFLVLSLSLSLSLYTGDPKVAVIAIVYPVVWFLF